MNNRVCFFLHVNTLQKLINNILVWYTYCCRFPDRVTIQGTFHPRDTMAAVYDWALSCLAATEHATAAAPGFDIYMSPPKVIYAPTNELTLQELNMVPAINLFLNWRTEVKTVSTGIGSYLNSSLLQPVAEVEVVDGKDESEPRPPVSAPVRSSTAFPLGTPLMPAKAASSASTNRGKSQDQADGKAATSGKEKTLKWFKL
jgi:hypothetical protein